MTIKDIDIIAEKVKDNNGKYAESGVWGEIYKRDADFSPTVDYILERMTSFKAEYFDHLYDQLGGG
jgi:hypothetical protein